MDRERAWAIALAAPYPLRREGNSHKLVEEAMNEALRGFLVEMAVLPEARR